MTDKYRHEIQGLYLYEDFPISLPAERIQRVQAMILEPTDVVIASYPKTGTTVLQEIVYLIRNNCDLELRDSIPNVKRVPFMELTDMSFSTFENLPHPRHMKSHLPYRLLPITAREGKAKIVYPIRNPKDTLVSYYHFYRMNKGLGNFKGTWNDFFAYFMESNAMLQYGNPFDHFREFLQHKNDDNLLIVFFEDIVQRPEKVVREIAKFLEYELTDDLVGRIADATSFKAMKENPMTNLDFGPAINLDHSISPFMRKGEVGDWKNYFSDEQNAIIDRMEKERMKETPLEFIYE